MIPEYFYCVAVENSVTDTQLERFYNEFWQHKFQYLKRKKHKEFFLSVIIQFNLATAIKICEFIMSKVRIPRAPDVELYKHEYVLHYLNNLPEEKADFLLLWGLVNTADDINKIKFVSRYLFRKEEEQKKHEPIIKFI